MVDERSDWDVCVVLADPEARDEFAREFPFGHGARVEIVAVTLDELRANPSEHGRYAAAHAQVVLVDRVHTGEPEAQRELFKRVEPLARRAGFGNVVDGWEPDLDWLRGTAGHRA